MTDSPARGELTPTNDHWLCFHCGELFTEKQAAADHFGPDCTEQPGCIQMLTETEKAIVEDRRFWRNEALKERDKCEQLEFVASLDREALISAFGTPDQREILKKYEQMKDMFRAQQDLLKFYLKTYPAHSQMMLHAYDPRMVTPAEYVANMEKLP